MLSLLIFIQKCQRLTHSLSPFLLHLEPEVLSHVAEGRRGFVPPCGMRFWDVEGDSDCHSPQPMDTDCLRTLVAQTDLHSHVRHMLRGTVSLIPSGCTL